MLKASLYYFTYVYYDEGDLMPFKENIFIIVANSKKGIGHILHPIPFFVLYEFIIYSLIIALC